MPEYDKTRDLRKAVLEAENSALKDRIKLLEEGVQFFCEMLAYRTKENAALRARLKQAEELAEALRKICEVPTYGEHGGPLVYLNAIYEDGSEWGKPRETPDAQKRHISPHTIDRCRQVLEAWDEVGKV